MFRQLVLLLVSAALALPGCCAQAKEALPLTFFQNLREGKTQTVVVYGTSLTVGGAWAKELPKYFEKNFPNQVKFFNGGGAGQNSDWGVANLNKKVLMHKPDLVFIEFSYNDVHEKFKLTPEKAAANLETIVQGIKKQNPQTDIVLQTMNLPWNAPNGNGSKRVRPQLEVFNDNYRRYAREQQLPLLDHYQNWLKLWAEDAAKYQEWLPDGSHPGNEASLAITWPAIEILLDKARGATQTQTAN